MEDEKDFLHIGCCSGRFNPHRCVRAIRANRRPDENSGGDVANSQINFSTGGPGMDGNIVRFSLRPLSLFPSNFPILFDLCLILC